MFKSFISLVAYSLVLAVICQCQSLADNLEQLNRLSQLKKNDFLQKNQLINSLELFDYDIKQLLSEKKGLTGTFLRAVAAYKSYFDQNDRCQSLNIKLGYNLESQMLNESLDFCNQSHFWVSNQTIGLNSLSEDLLHQLDIIQFAEKSVIQQEAFNSDTYALLAQYTRIRQISHIPFKAAEDEHKACLAKHANKTITDPIECFSYKDQLEKRQKIYRSDLRRQMTYGMSTRGPVISLDMKSGVLRNARDALTRINNTLRQYEEKILKEYNSCNQNLVDVKNMADQRLYAELKLEKKILEHTKKVQQIQKKLLSLVSSIKIKTQLIMRLANQIKMLFQ